MQGRSQWLFALHVFWVFYAKNAVYAVPLGMRGVTAGLFVQFPVKGR
jgi:hypothetical protein|tara:strand:+ start:20370 stop:20510 length:141 start_codon:yes stop_codon:yes gene_type:complete